MTYQYVTTITFILSSKYHPQTALLKTLQVTKLLTICWDQDLTSTFLVIWHIFPFIWMRIIPATLYMWETFTMRSVALRLCPNWRKTSWNRLNPIWRNWLHTNIKSCYLTVISTYLWACLQSMAYLKIQVTLYSFFLLEWSTHAMIYSRLEIL